MSASVSQDAVNGKAQSTPFLRFFTANWFGGTQILSYEEKGFYTDILCAMWERKGGLPDDDRWLAHRFGRNLKIIRRLRTALLGAEKLQSRNGFLENPRMMKEIAQWLCSGTPKRGRATQPDEQVQPPAEPVDDGQQAFDFSAPAADELRVPHGHETCTKRFGQAKSEAKSTEAPPILQTPEVDDDEEERRHPEEAKQPPLRQQKPPLPAIIDLVHLRERLIGVAGEALANEAAAPGLLNLAVVSQWIADGYDLELDIVPAIQGGAAYATRTGRKIHSWAYFSQRVADTHGDRNRRPSQRSRASKPPVSKKLAAALAFMREAGLPLPAEYAQ